MILPRTNLGHIVRDGLDAYVLETADAAGITRAIKELRTNKDKCEKLSRGAIAFAEKHFSWRRSASELATFYHQLTR